MWREQIMAPLFVMKKRTGEPTLRIHERREFFSEQYLSRLSFRGAFFLGLILPTGRKGGKWYSLRREKGVGKMYGGHLGSFIMCVCERWG